LDATPPVGFLTLLSEREVAALGLNFYEQGYFWGLQALDPPFKVREDFAGEYPLYAFP
jgi:hypothetical protein